MCDTYTVYILLFWPVSVAEQYSRVEAHINILPAGKKGSETGLWKNTNVTFNNGM